MSRKPNFDVNVDRRTNERTDGNLDSYIAPCYKQVRYKWGLSGYTFHGHVFLVSLQYRLITSHLENLKNLSKHMTFIKIAVIICSCICQFMFDLFENLPVCTTTSSGFERLVLV